MGARGGGTGMGAMGGWAGTGSGAMGGVGAGGCGLGFSMGESSRDEGFRVRVLRWEAMRGGDGDEGGTRWWMTDADVAAPPFTLFESNLRTFFSMDSFSYSQFAKLTQVVKFRTHMLQVPNLEFYFAICELEDRSNTFGKL